MPLPQRESADTAGAFLIKKAFLLQILERVDAGQIALARVARKGAERGEMEGGRVMRTAEDEAAVVHDAQVHGGA